MALEQDTVSTITAIASLVGALGALFAAIAAFRSAGTAKKSADRALAVEKRSQRREISSVANSIVAETTRVKEIADRLKIAYKTLGTFSGSTGSSRINLHIKGVENKQKEVIPIQDKSKESIENRSSHRNLGEEELTAYLADLEADLIQARHVKEKLVQELESVEEQNKTYRDKAINT